MNSVKVAMGSLTSGLRDAGIYYGTLLLTSQRELTHFKQAKVTSWHPYNDLLRGEKPSEGEQE